MPALPILVLRKKPVTDAEKRHATSRGYLEVLVNSPQEPERDFDGRVNRAAKIQFEDDMRQLQSYLQMGYQAADETVLAEEREVEKLEKEAAQRERIKRREAFQVGKVDPGDTGKETMLVSPDGEERPLEVG